MTAIASVSVVALFQTVNKSDGFVFFLGMVAVLVWFGALAVLALALAGQDPFGRGQQDMVHEGSEEIRIANTRLALGFVISLAAATLTLAALGLARYHHATIAATIALTADGAQATQSVCTLTGTSIDGDIHADTIDSDVLVIEVDDGGCTDKKVTLRIPRAQVAVLKQPA